MSSPKVPVNSSTRGKMFVISAPSGAGKTTLLQTVCAQNSTLKRAVTTTTRPMRDGEVDGRDYHFLTEADFQAKVEAGGFIEFANVFGNFYGLTREAVEAQLSQGQNIVVILDVQGAASVMREMPEDVVSIFILPPSPDELRQRLFARGDNENDDLNTRLKCVKWELSFCPWFKYIVVNDKFYEAVADILAVVEKEKPDAVPSVTNDRATKLLRLRFRFIKTVAASFLN